MNIEEQIVSLELSKKLKELGVEQSSLFFWTSGGVVSRLEALPIIESNYSAFTAAELFDLLPAFIDIKKDEPFNMFYLKAEKNTEKNIQYIVNYYSNILQHCEMIMRSGTLAKNIYDEKLADSLAKMLIYLIENKII